MAWLRSQISQLLYGSIPYLQMPPDEQSGATQTKPAPQAELIPPCGLGLSSRDYEHRQVFLQNWDAPYSTHVQLTLSGDKLSCQHA